MGLLGLLSTKQKVFVDKMSYLRAPSSSQEESSSEASSEGVTDRNEKLLINKLFVSEDPVDKRMVNIFKLHKGKQLSVFGDIKRHMTLRKDFSKKHFLSVSELHKQRDSP